MFRCSLLAKNLLNSGAQSGANPPGAQESILGKGGEEAMHCRLCNESFSHSEFEFGEVIQLGDEFWHVDCYSEYFDEALEPA